VPGAEVAEDIPDDVGGINDGDDSREFWRTGQRFIRAARRFRGTCAFAKDASGWKSAAVVQ
jgi:hypothetical protein